MGTPVRACVSTDWTLREGVQAEIRVVIKRSLRRFAYPSDAPTGGRKAAAQKKTKSMGFLSWVCNVA
ncbi:MAG: DUF3387 domain-containing protein [Undibacterium sp.]|nr:DUF3387 domain-containing protein [Opitutaceae bacterium]